MRPNYFISMGFLKIGGGVVVRANPLNPFWIGHWTTTTTGLAYWIMVLITYEGCSNMNASRFITFVTYMLRQNGICFYKGLYVTFKLAPDLKKNTAFLSICIPLNEGHLSILTNSMLRTYTSDIEERIIL